MYAIEIYYNRGLLTARTEIHAAAGDSGTCALPVARVKAIAALSLAHLRLVETHAAHAAVALVRVRAVGGWWPTSWCGCSWLSLALT